MRANIVRHRLERLQDLLSLIDDSLVLQHGAVVRKVDRGGLGGVLGVDALCFAVSFPESLEGSDGLWSAVN